MEHANGLAREIAEGIESLLRLVEGSTVGGIWLLNDADIVVEYTYIPEDSPDALPETRQIDLGADTGTGRIIVIRLPDVDSTAPAGLTTLAPTPGYCRRCGCSERNACVGADEEPCHWVAPDLCSACEGVADA